MEVYLRCELIGWVGGLVHFPVGKLERQEAKSEFKI